MTHTLQALSFALLLAGSLSFAARPAAAQDMVRKKVTAQEVIESIDRGRKYLLNQQSKTNGGWEEWPGERGGLPALVMLALLNAGQDVKSPEIQAGLRYLRNQGPPAGESNTYSVALMTMVFATAEPETDILLVKRNVQWLETNQILEDSEEGRENNKGGWGYGSRGGGARGRGTYADESNSQFAMLALYEAERAGVKVSDRTWNLAADYWLRKQYADDTSNGAWGYPLFRSGSGSMTTAGIASMVIAAGRTSTDARVEEGGRVLCCYHDEKGDKIAKAIEGGLAWLGAPRRMSVRSNPGPWGNRSPHHFYYLYGLERVGRMTARRFIGDYDWYREGAEFLVGQQDKFEGGWTGLATLGDSNTLVATSFATLFLSKGRWPVVVSRLKFGDVDWNIHRDSLNNLVRYTESRWKKNLTWQVVDIKPAKVEDLLESPVLFLSGRTALTFTPEQKKHLRQYVDEGGFIFAENCCGGPEFDKQFAALMKELFPESPLRKLDPSHPIWYADGKVNPEHLAPLYGLDACCRTSVVYCSESLSCYWELARVGRSGVYPPAVQARIEAYSQIGCNVLAYATNRELKEKLDTPHVAASDPGNTTLGPGRLSVAKISHGGGSDDAPAALSNLLRVLEEKLPIRTNPSRQILALTDSKIYQHPVLFMHGRRAFRLSDAERAALKQYLERGGILFADAICSSEAFGASVRAEVKAIFDQPLATIPADDPLLGDTYRGFPLSTDKVTLREPIAGKPGEPLRISTTQLVPRLEGYKLGDRWAVIFSPYDISCALENAAAGQCKSYLKADAAKIGINVLLYGLQE